ncbi:hypothetical protein [Streptomyces africanus]|nr:hypothetical protein [Streptomyces africanus]
MRTSELIELPLDCRLAPCSYGPNRVRHRLKSKVIKHRGHGGSRDEWVVVPEAYEAAGIARELADPGAAHTFPAHLDLCRRHRELREWANGGEGQRLGLPHLPDDVLTPRILRRTLAVELAHRPGGLFAAKLQLKHLSVTTTEGYTNRPGGAQACSTCWPDGSAPCTWGWRTTAGSSTRARPCVSPSPAAPSETGRWPG